MDKNGGNWFDDDPEWAELRRRLENQPAPPKRDRAVPRPKPQRSVTQKLVLPHEPTKISVNITIPKVKIPKIRLPKPLPRKVVWGGAAAMCALIAVIGLTVVTSVRKSDDKNSPADNPAVLSENSSKPDFKVILPEGKEEETESGKIGYDPQKKVVSFNDKIGIVNITVSQQPLPDTFKDDSETQLETLARNFSANEVIVPSNPKAYMGTSAKGPQTVIFYRNDLLVFIQSASKIDKNDWTDYIRSLR